MTETSATETGVTEVSATGTRVTETGVTEVKWPVPEPDLPAETSRVLAEATRAAVTAFRAARAGYSRAQLAEQVQMGADGTPTTRLDILVDTAVAEVVDRNKVNLISEEIGVIDHGSAVTLVVDPVDGTANATAGVPLASFAGVLAVDGVPTEALTCWLDTGRCWHAVVGQPSRYRTSGRRELDGAAVSLLRPHGTDDEAWWRITRRAARVRILSSSCLEAALVAEGATDAFADAGSDTHRIMDLAAAMVTVPAAGGAVLDARGRPLEISTDLSLRWSGVVAASRELAEALAEEIVGKTPVGITPVGKAPKDSS
jgi:myo-inositol-1(or 4)-monophosphatase